jgi:hypothetical protein
MVFVHIGTYIAVIPVAENGDIVKKYIRSLETKLIKPSVFGDYTL